MKRTGKQSALATVLLAAAVFAGALCSAGALTACDALPQLPNMPSLPGLPGSAGQNEAEQAPMHPVASAPMVQTAEDDFTVGDAGSAPYESRYYYNQLDPVRQQEYRVLHKALMAHAGKAVFARPYEEAMQDVAWAVYFDNPEFFYARRGGMYEGYEDKTDYQIEYVYDIPETYVRRAQIAAQVPNALQQVAQIAGVDPNTVPQTQLLDGTATGQPLPALDGSTARQLAWAASEHLANTISYNWEAAETDDEQFFQSFYDTNTIYGALAQGSAICGGYSQAYAYLCYQMGIPCVYVEGNIVSEEFSGAHAWDIVQIDGQWGIVDATWTDDEQGIGLRDDYFMTSDAYHNQDVTEFYVPAEIPAA